MLLMVMLLAILLTALGWYVARDIFAPCVAGPGIWFVAIFVFYVLPNNFFNVENNFPFALTIWLVGFFFSSLITENFTPASSSDSISREPNKIVLRIYTILTIISLPILSCLIIWQAVVEDPENIFRYMRIMNTGIDEDIEKPDVGILMYSTSLGFVMLFFSFMYLKNKWLIGLIVFLNILFAATTVSKTAFLNTMFASLLVCYYKGKVKIKHIVIGLVAFVALSFCIQLLRASEDDFETNSFLALYLSSSIVAFDYYVMPGASAVFGANTFRLFYAIGHSLGLCKEPVQTILPYVCVPELTNTYTNLYPFYEDFGMVGIMVFSVVYGIIYGFLYKKSKTGGNMELIVFSIFATFLMMEFIGEFIFTNLSLTLQYIIFAAIPFMIPSRKETK